MKEPLNRTKVVIRHLPPTLSLSSFFDQIDCRFSSRYNWSSFRPGKSSYKNQRHARAYINFNRPEDVFEFAEFFSGHVFVNEKGTQYKAIVEYAPSQRVPKSSKKDGREGTIYKDPEYVEFVERVSMPVENLPSADIQLERREVERAGVQEAPIVTPLMDFVRKRRAASSGNQAGGRSRLASPGKSPSSKHISEKKKYILKSTGKSANGKEKSTQVLMSQRENHLDTSNKNEAVESKGSISVDMGKKRILLLKTKEQEMHQQSKAAATATEASPSLPSKFNQRHDASGKIIRSILLNKESRDSQSSSAVLTEQKFQALNAEKGRRPPRPAIRASVPISIGERFPSGSDYVGKKSVDEKALFIESHSSGAGRDRQDRRTRSRERLDRIWTRRSDASHTSDGFQGKRGDSKYDALQSGHNTDISASFGGRNDSHTENGSHRHIGRRGPGKDDSSSKRGGIVSHGLHEKQVWVQKSASGS